MNYINWDVLKIQYELFGVDLATLAKQFGTSQRMVEVVAEEQGWRKLPIAEAANDYKEICSMGDIPPDLQDQLADRLKLLRSLQTATMNPQYVALEAALLGKAQDLLSADHEPGESLTILKTVSSVLKELRESDPSHISMKADDGKSSIVVQIMNKIDSKGEGTPVEIEVAKPVKQVT